MSTPSMSHADFATWCMSTPWAMMQEAMPALESAVKSARPARSTKPSAPAKAGGISVIPVRGTIVQRLSQLGWFEGGTSTQQISAALADANANDGVSQILLDIDSPGGSVSGVQELASEISKSKKPVTAFANSLAGSAAYWIGSAASEFYITPGGEVGSIGVWMMHQDVSGALEKAGIAVTLISAGQYKVEGNPYGPLDVEAKKFMQSRVTDYYNAFTRDVAKGRKTTVDRVRNGMGQGRCLGANQAKVAGMVDGVMVPRARLAVACTNNVTAIGVESLATRGSLARDRNLGTQLDTEGQLRGLAQRVQAGADDAAVVSGKKSAQGSEILCAHAAANGYSGGEIRGDCKGQRPPSLSVYMG